VTVRYFAAARAAAGVREETIDANSIGDALAAVRSRHDARFAAVLEVSSLLLDGIHMRDPDAHLSADVELDVLPPFAGG
jgi:molybdopterin synthase sulfur carrier subunit